MDNLSSPMKLKRISRASCLSFTLILILSGCAAAKAPSLDEAERFDSYSVYYAGEEVGATKDGVEFPLEKVSGSGPDLRSSTWAFIYGDCDPPTGDGGCSPPLQIQNFSTCSRWAGGVNQEKPLYGFRGAKARGTGRGLSNPIEIFTGTTTVVIFAPRPAVAKAAASALRNVRQARTSPLPRPVPGSLSGKLRCQDKHG
jgi:hypothetical protein